MFLGDSDSEHFFPLTLHSLIIYGKIDGTKLKDYAVLMLERKWEWSRGCSSRSLRRNHCLYRRHL